MPLPSVLSGAFKLPFSEQVAFFRGKLGNLVATKRWDDIQRAAHDTSFMVAGAEKADLLADLAMAVDRIHAEGKGIEAFRKDFRAIVQKHGWHDYTGASTLAGRKWRTRVIYQTNMATSYAAARVAQLRERGFKYWIYRHNDSVSHPRPLHQAWNGITLPADDPWWQTHGTPNGWGCRCYLLGARSARGAKRLGGKPDKKLNPDWNKIDPKTGTPVGIDKGWDYLPGDTVSDTVTAMASKTQQWEYALAKAYMQGVPAAVRDDLARAYRALPSVADDVRRYAASSLEGRKVELYRTIGLLTADDAAKIATLNTASKVEGFDYAIDQFAPRYVRDHHGDPKIEAARGQRAVVASDYAKLPLVLNSPDSVKYGGKTDVGRDVFIFTKKIGRDTYIAVFEIRAGRKMMALQTFYIKEGK
jgi:SPP1 gp7 family putative phage head morphogenesis protein